VCERFHEHDNCLKLANHHLAFFTYLNTVGFMKCNFLRYGYHFPVVLYYEVSVHFILTVLCVRSRFLELLAGLLFQKSEHPCFVWCRFTVSGTRGVVCLESCRSESSHVVVCCVDVLVQLLRPRVTFCDYSGNLRIKKTLVQLADIAASVMCSAYMLHHTVGAEKEPFPVPLILALR